MSDLEYSAMSQEQLLLTVQDKDAEIERLRQEYDQLQNKTSDQYDEQQAEIERLTAALTYIAYPQYDDRKYELMAAARAALEEEK